MISWLGRFLYGLFQSLNTTVGKVVVAALFPVVGFVVFVAEMIGRLNSYLNTLIAESSNALGQVTTFSFSASLGVANAFFPVDLAFGLIAVIISLWMVALLYRLVKSFIPTLS